MDDKYIIRLKDKSKKFDDEVILDNISLNIKDKEFITFLGPSGCGKTTTLRIIAGFLEADSGQVLFEEKDINNLPPHKRQVNTIFQRYQLFHHLNVYENIAFGLRNKRVDGRDLRKRKFPKRLRKCLSLLTLKVFRKETFLLFQAVSSSALQ